MAGRGGRGIRRRKVGAPDHPAGSPRAAVILVGLCQQVFGIGGKEHAVNRFEFESRVMYVDQLDQGITGRMVHL